MAAWPPYLKNMYQAKQVQVIDFDSGQGFYYSRGHQYGNGQVSNYSSKTSPIICFKGL